LFDEYWAPLLGERALGFRWAFTQLRKLPRQHHIIVETGCMRALYRELDFEKDGCSTLLFDRYVQHHRGLCYSVDCAVEAVKYAEQFVGWRTRVICNDSLRFLRDLRGVDRIDLLYLDSFDYDKANPEPSQQWHLFEFTAAMRLLRHGSLVMVDDNYLDGSGKGTLIRKFFTAYGIEPACLGRQLGWIMP